MNPPPSPQDSPTPPPIDPLSPEALARIGLKLPGQATGPKTAAGKARSRANAVKHGLRCRVVEPPGPSERQAISARMAAWERSFQPANEAEQWLVAFAAAESVRLDRCREREIVALDESVAAAERDWLRKRRAWARRVGSRLEDRPAKAHARLTRSAFGCDWLFARWDELAADLEVHGGYWSQDDLFRALRLLGLDPARIPPHDPRVGRLYRLLLAAQPAADPNAVDAFFEKDTTGLDVDARKAEVRRLLGSRREARLDLLAFVRDEQQRLRELRHDLWTRVEIPALEAACDRARTFDASPEAQLARRYEASHALSLHRALNGFFRTRREAERLTESDAPPSASPALAEPAPNPAPAHVPVVGGAARSSSPSACLPSEPPPTGPRGQEPGPQDVQPTDPADAPPPPDHPAPNELQNRQSCDATSPLATISKAAPGTPQASPPRLEAVPESSPARPGDVHGPANRPGESVTTHTLGAKFAPNAWPDRDR